MKETINLKSSLIGLSAFFLLYSAGILYLEEGARSAGVSVLAGFAVLFTLAVQADVLKKSAGLQRKFVLLLLTGTIFYAGAELIWFFEEKVKGSLQSVPIWSDLLYILNLLSYISAFTLLTFVFKNRNQVVYFAIDILIIFFSIITLLWVYGIHPLYEGAGVSYRLGAMSFIYPALELLLLLALAATMFVKRYFISRKAMLLYTSSIAFFLIGDCGYILALFYDKFEANSLLEVLWSTGVILQGLATRALLAGDRVSFRTGESMFNYEARSYPVIRVFINLGSILFLFLIFSTSQDLLAGAALLLTIFLVYSRQLLTSSQLSQLTDSYQHLARNLEDQVNKRTEELRKKNSELEKSSSRLKYLALHDQLTELWNRRALESRLKTLFEKSLEDDVKFALLFIDIDKFKEINDKLGHSYGDELLIGFTRRIREEFPEDAFIARQSGDEFVVILEGRKSGEEIENIIQRFFAANEEGYIIFGKEVKITFSLGVSFFPKDSRNTNELLQAADTAMYSVKQQGKNDYQFHA